jgi:hypothetical protein
MPLFDMTEENFMSGKFDDVWGGVGKDRVNDSRKRTSR